MARKAADEARTPLEEIRARRAAIAEEIELLHQQGVGHSTARAALAAREAAGELSPVAAVGQAAQLAQEMEATRQALEHKARVTEELEQRERAVKRELAAADYAATVDRLAGAERGVHVAAEGFAAQLVELHRAWGGLVGARRHADDLFAGANELRPPGTAALALADEPDWLPNYRQIASNIEAGPRRPREAADQAARVGERETERSTRDQVRMHARQLASAIDRENRELVIELCPPLLRDRVEQAARELVEQARSAERRDRVAAGG